MARSEGVSLRQLILVWAALTITVAVGSVAEWSETGNDRFGLVGGVEHLIADNTVVMSTGRTTTAVTTARRSALGVAEAGPAIPGVAYAGLFWTLDSARVVTADITPEGRPIVVAELTVMNTLRDVDLRIRRSDVLLTGPGGLADSASRFEHIDDPLGFEIAPGQTVEVTAVFKPPLVDDPTLEDLVVRFGEPGRVPAALRLDGTAVPSSFPIRGLVATPPESAMVEVGGRDALVRSISLRADLDAGPYRAADGRVLATVRVGTASAADPSADRPGALTTVVVETGSLVNGTAQAQAAGRPPETWRLRTTTGDLAPIRIDTVEQRDGVEVVLVFDAPTDLDVTALVFPLTSEDEIEVAATLTVD